MKKTIVVQVSVFVEKKNIKYLYTIRNELNDEKLYPIGSSCIRKFNRSDMNKKTALWKENLSYCMQLRKMSIYHFLQNYFLESF